MPSSVAVSGVVVCQCCRLVGGSAARRQDREGELHSVNCQMLLELRILQHVVRLVPEEKNTIRGLRWQGIDRLKPIELTTKEEDNTIGGGG